MVLPALPAPKLVPCLRDGHSFATVASDLIAGATVGLVALPRVVILRLRKMTAIDATGLHALEHFADVLHASRRSLLFCGRRDQPARMMEQAEFHEHGGPDNLLPSVQAALDRARVTARHSRRVISRLPRRTRRES
jgi:SulP family sulfate permease